MFYITYKRRLRRLLYAALGNKTSYFENVDSKKKKIIVGLAADYKNLGDVAITYAQTQFLKESFPDYQVIDFPISQTFKHYKDLKAIIQPGDIITMVGGGNTGDLYDSAEHPRQFLIKKFPNNMVVSFPQTVDFSSTFFGKHMMKKAKRIYSSHKNLILMAREKQSFEIYRNHFSKNKSFLFPDIVLYIDKSEPVVSRKGITLTFRNDKEKKVKAEEVNQLVNQINSEYGEVNFRDTHVDEDFNSIEDRENSLHDIWNQFRSSSLVVTDRLHGMIFCAITHTPCIAINNSNKKVQRVYEKWLTEFPNISMFEEFNSEIILQKIREKTALEVNDTNYNYLDKYFKELKEVIESNSGN